MSSYKLGEMVKIKCKIWNIDSPGQSYRYAYGMITQIRVKSKIAYIQFLPIENVVDQWITFDVIDKSDR